MDAMTARAPRISTESVTTLYMLREQALEERAPFESLYKDIAKYSNPSFQDWSDEPEESGSQTPPLLKDVYDNTMIRESSRLADGIQGWGFSRSNAWLRIAAEDDNLMEQSAVKDGLQKLEIRAYKQLSKSNFYDEGRSMVKACSDFGAGVMWRTRDPGREIPSYQNLHIKRCLLFENAWGEVDGLFRDMWLTGWEAATLFGTERLPQKVRDAYNKSENKRFRFTVFTFPVEKWDLDIDSRQAKGMPFYSVVIAEDEKTPIREGGYRVKPFWAWRWTRNPDGGVWPMDCPGIIEISNAKQLNGMAKDMMRIGQLLARPPLKATEQLRGRIDLSPNGFTYLKPGEDYAPGVAVGDPRFMDARMQALAASISGGYHSDLFLILSQNMERLKTATEVEGIKGEQAAMLTAFFGRCQVEFLECAVEDLIQSELDAGYGLTIGLPRSLLGKTLKIDLVSPLARLQKRYLLQEPTKQVIAEAMAIARLDPTALDWIDFGEHLKQTAEMVGIDRRVLRDIVDVQRIREGRAKQQAALMQAQLQEQQAKTQATAYGAAATAPEAGSPAAMAMGRAG